ncbi:MAG: preQ(1) synthase [Spirochaetes bacterium]|nr:preQ(1) synthase [Spirochaetota bacterium]
MNTREDEGLTQLGQGKATRYPAEYDPAILEAFTNKHQGNDYMVSLHCQEFTSLCPITGQPDFAKIRVSYIPAVKMVESKSLKLYLFSFRNHGDFHEDCINKIGKDLVALMEPKYLEVAGEFTPRGGISIWPVYTYSKGEEYQEYARQRLFALALKTN